MIITTTIRIDSAVKDTAKSTEAKQYRGGFSEYVEKLICADLKKKGIEVVKEAANA